MIVADSSVWIDFLNDVRTDASDRLDALLGTSGLLMGDLVLCEILLGVRDEGEAVRVTERLEALPLVAMGGRVVAIKAAQHYRSLRRRGITIRKTIDLLIATFCIEHNHRLLHSDRDFLPMVEHLGLVEA